jgi:CRP-like cAMP-binding protein/uncharacterized membrane protein YdbT with pleckstrin-like domain
MTLSANEAGRAWELFKDSPLFARWPDAEGEIAYRLSVRQVAANQVLFKPGDPADYLYLIAEGEVLETLPGGRPPWYQNRLQAKQYFGQDALFSGRHATRAVATRPTQLYLMTAAEVRVALEKNPDLRENLLFEKRAGRLREIPLFEGLGNGDIAWLAFLVQEIKLPAKADVPLDKQPGLWVIDRGQVAVNGHAGFGRSGWRLSAGNFFLTPVPTVGTDTTASSASAQVNSSLFWLRDEDFRRLIASFPDMRTAAGNRLDIFAELKKTNQLSGKGIEDEHLRHLAQFCAWDFVPAGQNIATQGAVAYSFVLMLKGIARVDSLDVDGRLRPQSVLRAGAAFGRTSLLESKRRDATVRALSEGEGSSRMPGAEILTLDRRDLANAFADRPDLWKAGVWLIDDSRQSAEPNTYAWQQEGETVAWQGRKHLLWLIGPEVMILLVFLLLLAAVLSLLGFTPAGAIAGLVLLILIAAPIASLFGVNYRRNFYAITNRRVTLRRHRFPFFDEIIDAPLEQVQDVRVSAGLYGRIFDYGTVTVHTAAKEGALKFEHVPEPDEVKNRVMQERANVTAATRARDKELLRKGIIESLQASQPVPDPDANRALGEIAIPLPANRFQRMFGLKRRQKRAPNLLPGGGPRPRPGWLIALTKRLPKSWQFVLVGPPATAPKPPPNQYIVRKHPIILVQKAGKQILLLLLFAALLAGAGLVPLDGLGIERSSLLLGAAVPFVFVFFWVWYLYEDYRNDVYVLTDEKIVDIERKPLALSKVTEEFYLDRVQNVKAKQRGIWSTVFDYGDVTIQTAAADRGVTFPTVQHPQYVQRLISQKIDERKRKQEQRTLAQRQRELIEGLQMYDEMLGERNAGRI